jgi:hypothetical protein
VNKWSTVVVAAASGFDLLAAGKHDGVVCSVPVIAWELVMGPGGYEGSWRPITLGFVSGNPDRAYAIKSPDGRVYAMWDCAPLSPGSTHASVEEWAFAVRVRACGRDLEGSA